MANDTRNTAETPQTALKAIRAKCLDCCSGSFNEVRDCGLTDCPLFHFRFGKNPDSQHICLVPESRIKDALQLEADDAGGELPDAILRIDDDGVLFVEIIEVEP